MRSAASSGNTPAYGAFAEAEILDESEIFASIPALVPEGSTETAFRSAVSQVLQEERDRGAECIRSRFFQAAQAGPETSRSVATMTDAIVRVAHRTATEILHPNASPTDGERLTVVAVGGYGRGQMAPHSDVDLMFLTPARPAAWVESVIESMLYLLWDTKLKIGHSVRDAESCIRLGRADMTIRTTLLEMRRVCGDAGLLGALSERAANDLFRRDGRNFIQSKLEEREARHNAAGGSRYLLTPNLKDGKGGLRDIQMLYWLAKCMHGPLSLEEFVKIGLFDPDEALALERAERNLWTYRFHLHYSAKRAVDILHFGHQQEIAAALEYRDSNGLRSVEHFMRDYYRTAKEVGDLTRIFCAALEERQVKDRPGIRGLLTRFRTSGSKTGSANGFREVNGRLAFDSDDAISGDPVSVLRLFRESQVADAHIHPDAYRMIVKHLGRIDEQVRADPEANRIFLDILIAKQNPVRILRRMSETGVLGRFLPDFDHVVGLMQFDEYHYYTVDEHTLLALDTLAQIENGKLRERHPLASELTGTITQRRALHVALLLHDIGKGLEADHSEKGAKIAAELCPRLGLDEAETETVVWLVRNHLAMTNTAQRRDLTDPATVREFAALVQERERLALLLILTVCDLTSVAPEYWNGWKAQLLRDLFSATLRLITSGQDAHSTDTPVVKAKEELRRRLADRSPAEIDAFHETQVPSFWLGLDADTHETLARMAFAQERDRCSIRLEHDDFRGATKAYIYASDRTGLLADIAAGFASVRAMVSEVRTYTSLEGMAASVFWVHSAYGAPFQSEEEFRPIRTRLRDAILNGGVRGIPIYRRFPGAVSKFEVPVRVRVENDASDLYTLVEVTAQDRPGLLADLARAINDANARIFSAIVSTYGERAVDSFYVKDPFGLKLSGASTIRAMEKRVRAAAQPRPAGTA